MAESKQRTFWYKVLKSTNKARVCPHSEANPYQGKIFWARLVDLDGSITYKCERCISAVFGFYPTYARILWNKERACVKCQNVNSVNIVFSEEQVSAKYVFICIRCFKRLGMND